MDIFFSMTVTRIFYYSGGYCKYQYVRPLSNIRVLVQSDYSLSSLVRDHESYQSFFSSFFFWIAISEENKNKIKRPLQGPSNTESKTVENKNQTKKKEVIYGYRW